MLKRILIITGLLIAIWGTNCFAYDQRLMDDAEEMLFQLNDIKYSCQSGDINYNDYHDLNKKVQSSIRRFNDKYSTAESSDGTLSNIYKDSTKIARILQGVDSTWHHHIYSRSTDISKDNGLWELVPKLKTLHKNIWGKYETKEVLNILIGSIDNNIYWVKNDIDLMKLAK